MGKLKLFCGVLLGLAIAGAFGAVAAGILTFVLTAGQDSSVQATIGGLIGAAWYLYHFAKERLDIVNWFECHPALLALAECLLVVVLVWIARSQS